MTVIPFNSVFGVSCEKRNLKVLHLEGGALHPKPVFDFVVTIDCLHLTEDPETAVQDLKRWLKKDGTLIARVPNLNRLALQRYRYRQPRRYWKWGRSQIGAHPLSRQTMKILAKRAGFASSRVVCSVRDRWRVVVKNSLGTMESAFADYLYLNATND